ncbi:MAG: exodeoxyribonuclease VII large subunit [Desulfuromonadaceae bacterium]|nr:exodeoxyribonuclease VII large subunit [Desulfuromonadaceae bacterium]
MLNEARPLLTVSRLNALLRDLVEENFMNVRVAGELSNFVSPVSGHWYFSLKDDSAQLRGVMFRGQNSQLRFRPENGMEVICVGRISVYPQRGELQLIVDELEPRGVGGLQLAFEQLKQKLAVEGLFSAGRKRPLPVFPETIGVVTSATGAALQDIVQILRRRGFGGRVLLRSVPVQGATAAGEIVAALADLNRHAQADVLIVGRGGGSLEDLWAFNEECVARAIAASKIPVISAVGHEIDYTIADFVADLRAPTPSAAAEMVSKSRLELESHLDQLTMRLSASLEGKLQRQRERFNDLTSRLRQPQSALRLRVEQLRMSVLRLREGARRQTADATAGLREASGRLDQLSPLATLARGYALVTTAQGGRGVRDASRLQPGDSVTLRFAAGRATATIDEVES